MLHINSPKEEIIYQVFLSSNCGAFGVDFATFLKADKFKKYGVYIDGNFYKVATLDDLLVVKKAMGI